VALKVIIADDEMGMRLVLKKAIEKFREFEIIGEAEDGNSALLLFEQLRPHVVFLDVEMPEINGLDCARKIFDINPKTIIIFATAHSEYMPQAFEMYAFDYMIKPFKVERIFQTLDRILELKDRLEPKNRNEEIDLSKELKQEKRLDKLMIKNKEGISFVEMKEIVLVQREERNTVIYTRDEEYVTSEGLSEIEERLDKYQFIRSHKSYIINLSMIHKIYPYGRWTYIVKLKNTSKDALLTHEKYEEVKSLFNQ
jgi:two-component system LytT family response regulator